MLDRNERTVNFGQWAQYWAFDATSHIIFGSPYGFMRKGGDIGGMLGALNLGLRYCAIIGQVPELHPWLIGNNTVMSILSKFQRFPNPTAIIHQEAEIRLDSHSQEYHICGNSLLCKLATSHRLTKDGSRNTDSINLRHCKSSLRARAMLTLKQLRSKHRGCRVSKHIRLPPGKRPCLVRETRPRYQIQPEF